jgi:uncharacterized cupin superfamily protein
MSEITEGPGFAVGSLDAMGEGYGFRKVRKELGVTAFGVNAIVIPPGFTSNYHLHEKQEELYICLEGPMTIEFDGEGVHTLEPGDMARVSPEVARRTGNPGPGDAVYVCVGGKDGYVGRDGVLRDEDS